MSTLQKYKPIPELKDLKPGYIPGWKYDVLILQAEPVDKVGSIMLADKTKDDEKYASTLARLVDMSPIAFMHPDWPDDAPPPYQRGDIVLCKRYPAGLEVFGIDGRRYLVVNDSEIVGKRVESDWAEAEATPALPPVDDILKLVGRNG